MLIFIRLVRESILMAWHALVVNKLRTLLSLLGITIGIFAIISVFTAVDGLESSVKSSVDRLGSNVIFIQKWPWAFGGDYPWWKYWNRPLPSIAELNELHERTTLAESMAFQAYAGDETIKYQGNSVESATVELVSHDYEKLNSFNLLNGRYFTETESASGYPVAIIGYEVAKNLFPQADPLDKVISIRGRKVKVIGVYTKEGESIMGNSHDPLVTVPVNYARKFMDIRSDRLNPFIAVKALPGVSNKELMDDLRSAMRNIRRLRPVEDDNFALNESRLLSNQIGNLFSAVSMAGWIIGGFSILVGGFGIANIMFVSVKERTPIIGIQKSLGAKNYFVLIQFLTESVVLCMIGGILGLLLVFLGSIAATAYDLEMPLTTANIILGLTVSALIGIISGFIPSYTASRLDPVEAIRANG